eukprot:CAMPEP_0203893720 /NCGR_PEP_ID=MMETSP0359-20131031/36764_1 /ASSEMBLY_ACC=CAM_ASM_000338 /TAXON_ID=268821 /ORGANISM="Scrippsiella Hangoei, Strain SHTV-5" /LENGTH=92 /DNA_ID=CAMNT_0050815929 /DNA_START=9 /DNA_END=288 /DNA_ORIENTATION=-
MTNNSCSSGRPNRLPEEFNSHSLSAGSGSFTVTLNLAAQARFQLRRGLQFDDGPGVCDSPATRRSHAPATGENIRTESVMPQTVLKMKHARA